jgi:hypothetical protein
MTDNAGVDVKDQRAINTETSTVSQTEQTEDQAATEYSQAKNVQGETMHVKIYSPFHEYYDGQAFSLSATNLTGPFDILPKHHNFISLLSACELVIRVLVKGQQQAIKILISGGLIHVKADEVLVFLDV